MDTHNENRMASVGKRSAVARDILRHIATGADSKARDQLMGERDRVRVLAAVVREVSWLPFEQQVAAWERVFPFCDKLARELL